MLLYFHSFTLQKPNPIPKPRVSIVSCPFQSVPPMGLLDHLWDDTVAGPPPDSGLGKLRKNATFTFRTNVAGKETEAPSNRRSFGEEAVEDAVKVTRSIMIVKPSQKDSPPVSPAGSTPPVSPFAGAGGREAYRFRRRSASFAYEKASGVGPRSAPTSYDM